MPRSFILIAFSSLVALLALQVSCKKSSSTISPKQYPRDTIARPSLPGPVIINYSNAIPRTDTFLGTLNEYGSGPAVGTPANTVTFHVYVYYPDSVALIITSDAYKSSIIDGNIIQFTGSFNPYTASTFHWQNGHNDQNYYTYQITNDSFYCTGQDAYGPDFDEITYSGIRLP